MIPIQAVHQIIGNRGRVEGDGGGVHVGGTHVIHEV